MAKVIGFAEAPKEEPKIATCPTCRAIIEYTKSDVREFTKLSINNTMKEQIIPIKPSEVTQYIPDWIVKGANECIQAHYVELRKESHFTQDKLMEYCLKYAPEGVTRQTVFKNHWLDIEPIYRKEGWIVEYDKPAYCENYEANFTFKVPK